MSEQLYLVDYDIPTHLRQKFYRDLRKALARYLRYEKKFKSLEEAWEYAESGGAYVKSTLSVILTDDLGIAETVYSVAIKYGEANLYRVEPVSPPRYSREFWEWKKQQEEEQTRKDVQTLLQVFKGDSP